MRKVTAGRTVAASILALTLVGTPLPIALAQDASPVASPSGSPLAALDPALVAGTSIGNGNDQRTGEVAGQGIVGSPSILWSAPMDIESGWFTAAGDGIVVVQTAGELRVLDRTSGNPLWTAPWEPSSGDPLLDDGVIYVTGIGGASAFDASSGAQLWVFEPKLDKDENPDFPLTELDSSPLKIGDTVYVSSSTWGGVYALDAATGAERWRFDSNGDVSGSLSAVDDVLYFTSNSVNLYPEAEDGNSQFWAVDATTGQALWSVDLGAGVQPFSTSSIADGKAVFTVYDPEAGQTQIRAIDLEAHAPGWTAVTPVIAYQGAMAVANGLVLLPGNANTGLYAYDLETGELAWEHETADTAHLSPAVSDGVLYVQTALPSLDAIDLATGGTLWSLPLGDPTDIDAWGVRLSNGTAFVDTGTTVVAVTGDGGPAPAVTGGNDYPAVAAVAADADDFFGTSALLEPVEPMAGAQGVNVAPSGEIYVIDGMNNRIQIFHADGTPDRIVGEAGDGDGQFHFLFDEQGRYGGDVVFAADGTTYVSDMANSRIQVFDKDMNFLTSWSLEANHTVDRPLPTGIALDEAHNRLFIGDWDSRRVLVYALDGTKIGEWGIGGPTDDTRFADVFDIAVAPDGTVYITDSSRNRVRSYTADGEPQGAIGGFGTDPGRFGGLVSVAVDADGNLYTSDYPNNRIQVFSPSGEVIGIWSPDDSDLGDFDQMWSIGLSGDGKLYVVDENYEEGQFAVVNIGSSDANPSASPIASPAA